MAVKKNLFANGLILILLTFLGYRVAQYKISLIKDVTYMGPEDSGGYAWMARSLVSGNGLKVPYVSFFFDAYPREIWHREDHWPPFLSFLIAPFFAKYGFETWVARLAPIYVGSIGLPIATAMLGFAYSKRGYVGLAAGLLILGNLHFFAWSLEILSDLSLAMLTALLLATLFATRRWRWMHIVAGLLCALAYYAKGSEVVLLGVYPVAAACVGGVRSLRTRWPWIGLGCALAGMAPWFISNWAYSGNPLYSTQNYVSGLIGVVDSADVWEGREFYPYFGEGDRPKTSDRWGKYASQWPASIRANVESITRVALLGPDTDPRAWENFGRPGTWIREVITQRQDRGWSTDTIRIPLTNWQEPPAALMGIAAVGLFVAILIGAAARPIVRRWRRKRTASDGTIIEPTLLGPTAAAFFILGSQVAFLTFLWAAYQSRFIYFLVPFMTVAGCTFFSRAFEWPLKIVAPVWLSRWHWGATVVLTLAAIGLLLGYENEIHARTDAYIAAHRGPPFVDYRGDYEMGRYIAKNFPDAVIMCRKPPSLVFHCAPTNRAICLPWGTPEEVFAVARYYHATLYYADWNRPINAALASGRIPGVTRLSNAPTSNPLYQLDLDKLPGGEIDVDPEKVIGD